jgi:hypothetical protein
MDETPDYSKYTLDELCDVHDHIDKDKYPERYERVIHEINTRKNDPVKENLRKNPVEIIISRIRYVYYVLIVFTLIGIFIGLHYWKFDFSMCAVAGIKVTVYIFICYGLMKMKTWVIPLALIVSAFGIIIEVFVLYMSVKNGFGLIVKSIYVFILCFYLYQIYFFRKKEIARFFKSENIDIF